MCAMTPDPNPDDPVLVAQGGVVAMRTLCEELRRGGLTAALVPPPDGAKG